MASSTDIQQYYFGLPMLSGSTPQTMSAWGGQVQWLTNLLRNAGIPEILLPYAIAQVYYETRDMSSDLNKSDNNYSGISYTASSRNQSGRSSKYPKFAHFTTPEKWAADYVRILSVNRGAGRPIDATTAQQFYLRLKKNGYFTTEEAKQYSAGFNTKLKKINEVLNYLAEQNKKGLQAMESGGSVNAGDWTAADTAAVQMQKFKDWTKNNWPYLAGGGVLLFILTKRK